MEVIAIFEQLYFQPVKQIAYCHVTFDWPVTLTRALHLNEPQINKTLAVKLIDSLEIHFTGSLSVPEAELSDTDTSFSDSNEFHLFDLIRR